MQTVKLFLKSIVYFTLTSVAFMCVAIIFATVNSLDWLFITVLVLPILLWLLITIQILKKIDFQQMTFGKIITILLSLAVIIYMYFEGKDYDWDLGLDDLVFMGFVGLISLYFAFFKISKTEIN